MKFLKPRIISVLRDKTANNLVVAILLAFSLSNILSIISFTWQQGMTFDQWWSMIWRQLVSFAVALLTAELISRLAKR